MTSLNEIQAGFDVAYFRISDSVKLIGMTDRDEAGRWAARHVMMLIILFIQRSWRRGGQFARKKQSICAAKDPPAAAAASLPQFAWSKFPEPKGQ